MKNLLLLLAALCVLGCKTNTSRTTQPIYRDGTESYYDKSAAPFYHGVASGDPLSDRVVIWTRVTPDQNGPVKVRWMMSTDRDFGKVLKKGVVKTDATRDYTVKVDVTGLDPGMTYYYRFEALGARSVIGRTKTVPADHVEQVRFVVVSCSNWEFGYFNAFGRIADRPDLDAVLHLGDYIYEYAPGGYGDTTIGRFHLPPKEILTLQDYRTRYALYRLDPDFQRAHQMHPFITVWDDHEITNNAYRTGAQNHQPEQEGDYMTRREIARQVYLEWLPVRETRDKEIYRKIGFGDLVDLIMLDERLAGRTKQVDSISDPSFRDPSRSMLGERQLSWFFDQLATSTATWKVIGNQVIFSDLDISMIFPGQMRNLDAWDGYPYEKERIINFIREKNISNVIFTTGDTHCSWAFEVPTSIRDYRNDADGSTVAVEFGTTSVSAANYDFYTSMDTVRMAEHLYTANGANPHLKYVDLSRHGYLLVTLSADEAVAEWWYVDTLRHPSQDQTLGSKYRVDAGSHRVERVEE